MNWSIYYYPVYDLIFLRRFSTRTGQKFFKWAPKVDPSVAKKWIDFNDCEYIAEL